jgi:hypothetical protein
MLNERQENRHLGSLVDDDHLPPTSVLEHFEVIREGRLPVVEECSISTVCVSASEMYYEGFLAKAFFAWGYIEYLSECIPSCVCVEV